MTTKKTLEEAFNEQKEIIERLQNDINVLLSDLEFKNVELKEARYVIELLETKIKEKDKEIAELKEKIDKAIVEWTKKQELQKSPDRRIESGLVIAALMKLKEG